ncbi:hypothetical protein ACHAXT_000802 [Thalassiosira profunda]
MVHPTAASAPGRPAAADRRQWKRRWHPTAAIAVSAAVSSALMWHQLQLAPRTLPPARPNDVPRAEPIMPTPEPIRFISVAGLYNSGTTGLWNSIKSNEGVAAERGIELKVYGMSESGGYPPCGVALQSDSSVEMQKTMGNSSDIGAQNRQLYEKYGTMWGNWDSQGPKTLQGMLKMKPPPHKQEVFYTWWKHTPPQHPMLACFRPDTLYVVLIRHPRTWQKSMINKRYDLRWDESKKLWTLRRSNPRRLPPMMLYFRSLYNVWEYYMRGYISWEEVSAGENCYAKTASDRRRNCLGGANEISASQRNIVLVRYEDYLLNPKRTLARIFSFATRGAIDAEVDADKFVPYEEEKVKEQREKLLSLQQHHFFSVDGAVREEAKEMVRLCTLLGYSCDDTPALFIET